MMNYFSFGVSVLVVLYTIYRVFFSRISVKWKRTMWLEKIIGIEIWFWNKERFSATDYGFAWGKEAENEFEIYRRRK